MNKRVFSERVVPVLNSIALAVNARSTVVDAPYMAALKRQNPARAQLLQRGMRILLACLSAAVLVATLVGYFILG